MKTGLLHSAARQLGANIPTTLFMCAGIVVGIAVLITVIALGQGTKARILERVDNVGAADTFTIRTTLWGQGGGGLRGDHGGFLLSFDDLHALNDELPGIAALSPVLNTRGTVEAGAVVLEGVSVQGVALNFQQVRAWPVQSGTFFSDSDIETGSRTAVIGSAIAARYPYGANPLEQTIQVEETRLEVSGVLESRGATGSGRNADEVVLVTEPVFAELFQPAGLSTITVLVSDVDNRERVADQAKLLLEERNPGHEVFVRFSMATATARDEAARTLSLYLSVIAAIALLIGGMVMMKLASLSISGRTREIGLRKALGARDRDISLQVMLEMIMISLTAGVIGTVLGYLLSNELAARMDLQALFTWHAPLAGIAVAILTGIVFGVRPASRAARLDPVVALRGTAKG